MQISGINFGYLWVMLFNLLLIVVWIIFAILALFQLRRLEMSETARAMWAALILLIPIAGAIAFWIVRPASRLDRNKTPDG